PASLISRLYMSPDPYNPARSSLTVDALVRLQNPDGGWSYCSRNASRSPDANPRASWTEPTAYAVLAMVAAGENECARRGIQWILSTQRPDGGWSPQRAVQESTWVTALVALLPPENLGSAAHARAIAWLLATCGQESSLSYRLRQRLLGVHRGPDQEFP